MQLRTGPVLGLALALAVAAGGVLARAEYGGSKYESGGARYRFKPYAEFLADVADRPRRVVYTPYPVSARLGLVRSFVHVADGTAVLSRIDLVADGPLPIAIRRVYHSARKGGGSFGAGGWHLTAEERVVRAGSGGLEYSYGNGARVRLDAAGRFLSPLDAYLTDVVAVTRPDADTIQVRTRVGITKRFRAREDGFELAEVSDGSGNRLEFEYSAAGGLSAIASTSGARVTLSRYADGTLAAISDSRGRTVHYGYDGDGRLAAVTDVGGHEWRYRYDASGRLAATTSPSDADDVAFDYDSNGRVATSRVNGRHHTYAYGDRLTRVTADGLTTEFVSAPTGMTVAIANALGTRTELRLDGGGVPVSLWRNGRQVAQMQQLLPGAGAAFQTWFVASTGETYWLRHDTLGRVVAAASQGSGPLYEVRGYRGLAAERMVYADRSEERASFDARGELALLRRRDGSTLEFDRQGSSWYVKGAQGRSAELQFDQFGRLGRVSTPDRHVLAFGYSDVGLRETAETSYGAQVRYAYDASGSLFHSQVRSQAGGGPDWTYALGPDQRVDAVFGNTAGTTRFEYDSGELLRAVSHDDAASVRFLYDGLRRLTRVERAGRSPIEYRYAQGEPDLVAQLSARALPVYNQQREINDYGSRFDVQLTRVRPAALGLFTDDEVAQEITLAGDPSRWNPGAYLARSVAALKIDALLGTDPRGIGAFTTPSNRLFVPAEYWSVNCCICLCEDPEYDCYMP